MKLIVGLGNPGPEYEKTRHNVGFMGVDRLAEALHIKIDKQKFQSLLGETNVNGEKVILLKPMTYMNLSGQAVRASMDWYKPELEDFVVLFDDMDIPLGSIRLRMKGSAGGHNGIKSIIQHIGTQDFQRIKIGIGRPNRGQEVIRHVLQPFEKQEWEPVVQSIDKASDAAQFFINNGFTLTMNRFNGS